MLGMLNNFPSFFQPVGVLRSTSDPAWFEPAARSLSSLTWSTSSTSRPRITTAAWATATSRPSRSDSPSLAESGRRSSTCRRTKPKFPKARRRIQTSSRSKQSHSQTEKLGKINYNVCTKKACSEEDTSK